MRHFLTQCTRTIEVAFDVATMKSCCYTRESVKVRRKREREEVRERKRKRERERERDGGEEFCVLCDVNTVCGLSHTVTGRIHRQ